MNDREIELNNRLASALRRIAELDAELVQLKKRVEELEPYWSPELEVRFQNIFEGGDA